jgi:hypothetical protein
MKQSENSRWGHCRNCKHFESPAKAPRDGEEAACGEPTLAKFQLRVFGTSGCNHFELRPGFSIAVEEPRAET